jgi:hypothetical protein
MCNWPASVPASGRIRASDLAGRSRSADLLKAAPRPGERTSGAPQQKGPRWSPTKTRASHGSQVSFGEAAWDLIFARAPVAEAETVLGAAGRVSSFGSIATPPFASRQRLRTKGESSGALRRRFSQARERNKVEGARKLRGYRIDLGRRQRPGTGPADL